MEQNYLTRAAKYLADLRKRKAWKKVVSALGTAVVFCTVYALILPAITLTRPLTCTVEVHHHNESCYAAVEPSTIAAGVNLPRQICGVESIYADVALGVDRADFVLHTHNDSCWQDGQLVCTLPERHVHQHTAACYQTVKELTCGHPEVGTDTVPTNPDTQQPPVTVEPEPVPIHKHTEQCYTNALVCELEETPATAGHTHDESCYTTETIPSELICPITAETDPEHIHDANCYGPEQTNQVLVCGQEESLPTEGHTHTDACWRMELTCGMQEGQPELTSIPDEPVPTSENDFDTVTIADEVPVTVSQDGIETNMDGQQAPAGVHVHTDACYVEREILNCPDVIDTPHEHDDTCRDVNGNYICGRAVTREHIHTAECFVMDAPDENLPEPERTPICGKQEHEHGNECYAPIEEPTVDRTEQDQKWGALFWSDIVAGTTETISGQITANWMDTQNMDIMALEALRNAEAADLTRFMDSNIGIWVGDHLYNAANDGPMAPDAPFTVQLNWNLDASHFATETTTTTVPAETTTVPQEQQRNFTQQDMEGYSGDMAIAPIAYAAEQVVPETTTTAPMTTTTVTASGTLSYYYRLPDGIVVENVEKRVLYNEGTDNPALSYSVMDNVLNVTYYAPAESVNTTFTLKANWAEGVTENETFTLNWSNSTFSTVEFASPKLELTKSMGENGLRVEEDGTVWADYTVTVKNDSPVTAKDITLSDTLEAELFHFYRGGFAEGSADYTVTSLTPAATGEDGSELPGETTTTTNETFPAEFDGGNTLVFPTFELAPGETKTFAYMAQMSAEDRETTDAAILAEAETLPQGQRPSGVTVSNTATLSCPGSKETPELTAKAQATYGGPDSKHIEDYPFSYETSNFTIDFVINGDAILPPGITADRVEELGTGSFLMKVNSFAKDSAEYQEFAQKLESEDEDETEDGESTEEAFDLSVLGLELRYNNMKLDLSDCDITATITPTEKLLDYTPNRYKSSSEDEEDVEVYGDKGFGVELKAFTLEKQTDAISGTTTEAVVEKGSIYIDVTDETSTVSTASTSSAPVVASYAADVANSIEPLMLTSVADTANANVSNNTSASTGNSLIVTLSDDIMGVSTEDDEFPTYQVEFAGKVKLLKVVSNGDPGYSEKSYQTDLSILDNRKLKDNLPDNSLGNEGDYIAYLELEDDTVGTFSKVKSVTAQVPLFESQNIMFNPKKDLDLGMFMILDQFSKKEIGNTDASGSANYTIGSFAIIEAKNIEQLRILEEKEKNDAISDAEKETLGSIRKEINLKDIGVTKDSQVKLTTKADKASESEHIYYLPEGALVRLICEETTDENYTAPVTFYDYDISDGKVYTLSGKEESGTYTAHNTTYQKTVSEATALYLKVNEQGINSFTKADGTAKLGFGNANGNVTGIAEEKLENGLYINQANKDKYRKCTFGIVTGLNSNGTIQYASDVSAPPMFGEEGSETGKVQVYDNYELIFDRQGDTYTMSGVKNTETEEAVASASQLDHLTNTGKIAATGGWTNTPENVSHITLFQNNFWPMDDAKATWGTDKHDYVFGSASRNTKMFNPDQTNNNVRSALKTDDGQDHNPYFGMRFDFKFEIPEKYVGPLEYCFFGDDDLWLFVDGTLVCDIGGVHQAAGEYVDLRDWLPIEGNSRTGKPTVGTHSLTLYYTERGASGSTCWMQFTLPGLSKVKVPVVSEGGLIIEKELSADSPKTDREFEFIVTLEPVEGTEGTEAVPVGTPFDVLVTKLEDKVLVDKIMVGEPTSIKFKAGENAYISDLPKGMKYTIQESDATNAYRTDITTNWYGVNSKDAVTTSNSKEITGTIEEKTNITVTYVNSYYYSLPETGGLGTSNRIWYTYGALPVMAAAVVVYKRSRKKGGNVS